MGTTSIQSTASGWLTVQGHLTGLSPPQTLIVSIKPQPKLKATGQ
jgi:hypothetical protein